MRRSTAILVALAALAFVSTSVSANDESEKALAEGKTHYASKEWKAALDCWERALKEDPKNAQTQSFIAAALSQLGRLDDAIKAYDKALALADPKEKLTVSIHQEKALVYGTLNKYDDAVAEFKKSLELSPDDEFSWRNLGVTYARMSKMKDALHAWEKSLASNPDQPGVKKWVEDTRKNLGLPPAAPPGDKPEKPEARSGPDRKPFAPAGDASFELPSAGGSVTSPDLVTLVVACPSRGELVYYDTVKLTETKRVALDFQPGQLAIQGKTIFATSRAGSVVYALDLDTGKVQKTIKIPGEPLAEIACHRTKGNVYVSNAKDEVFSIEPRTGAVAKTEARGRFLAVDPVQGATLFTGSSPAEGRSILRKYSVKGKDIAPLAQNKNAATRGGALHVSPDGKRVTIAGSDGWQPDGGAEAGAAIVVWSADDAVTSLGQIDAVSTPEGVAFHPTLNYGVALGGEGDLTQFQARSLVLVHTTKVEAARGKGEPGWVVFVGKGERVAFWRPGDPSTKESGRLFFFPLELTKDDKAALEKVR